jgi:1,4-dihydroxy-2-naphthoate octaprenyltransferase
MKDIKIFDKSLAQHIAIFFVAWFTPVLLGEKFSFLEETIYQFIISLVVYILLEIIVNIFKKK